LILPAIRHSLLPRDPASFFGIVLGLAGLANTWRVANSAWGLPSLVGEILTAVAALALFVIATLYASKWIVASDEARSEAEHAVQCCFIGLGGVATVLIAQGMLPYSQLLAPASSR
jgi:tellurite resistance protein